MTQRIGGGDGDPNPEIYASENDDALPSIGTAIDRAESDGGGTVVVGDPGTHTVSLTKNKAAINWTTDDITLRIGAGVIVKLADNELGGGEGYVIRVGDGATAVDNAAIVGEGTVDGNTANNAGLNLTDNAAIAIDGPVTNARVEDVAVDNSVGDAVICRGVDDANRGKHQRVSGVTVKDGCAEGILAQWITDWAVENCHVEGTTQQDGVEPAAECREWVIKDCVIEDTGQGGIDIYDGASQGVVDGCVVRRWGASYGIHLSDTATTSRDVTIKNCIVEEDAGGIGGIQSAGSHEDVTIRDCEVRDTGTPIWVTGSLGPYEVVNCTMRDCTEAFELRGSADRIAKGNTLINVNPGGSAACFGRSASRLTFQNNTIMHPDTGTTGPDYGYWVVDPTAGYSEGNTIYTADFATSAINDQSGAGHSVTGNLT